MAKRSLQASVEGMRKAKLAFKRKGWTQEYLAAAVGLETRQPIWKFFTGKPIDRQAFNEICLVLDLEPAEIAQKSPDEELIPVEKAAQMTLDIHSLVEKLRSLHYGKIQAQCGTLHILDIAQPVNLNEIYVDVNILEEMNSQTWIDINKLKNCEPDKFDRFGLGKVRQQRIGGLEAVLQYSKLMVLGKPGSGKTTFLQSIAISCNQGLFQPDSLPIFINLKNLAEDTKDSPQTTLVNYIHSSFAHFQITEQEIITILSQGKALILLDALDEVAEKDSERINQNLRQFIESFHQNKIIISCRIAAQPY